MKAIVEALREEAVVVGSIFSKGRGRVQGSNG
jgi:hypothetical protein